MSPEGVSQTVLKGRFDFEWQMGYELAEPVALAKGSKLQFITHFDNSKGNRFNPNPETKVLWGPQNWDEMSNCFIGVLFDRSTAPEKVFLEAFNLVPKDAVAPASNASTGGSSGQ